MRVPILFAVILALCACADDPAYDPQVPQGDPRRGRAALAQFDCGVCHVIPVAIAIDNFSEGLSVGEIVLRERNGRNKSQRVLGWTALIGGAVFVSALCGDRSPHETYIQIAGDGHRIAVLLLRTAMAQSTSLQQTLLRVGYAFTVQTAQTAMANGCHKIEERLARWLLMAHDRVEGDDLALTHEFLARMLGVRRPGVTVALKGLENNGLISAKRGGILIIDRLGLEDSSNGAYGD